MKRQDELNEAWCKYMGKCSTEIMQALAFALRWADAHPCWISVEDGLPPIGGIVLVAIPLGGELNVLPLSIKNKRDLECLSGMTHWMALPAPPEHFADVSKKISGSSEIPTNRIIGTPEHIQVALDVIDKKGGEQ